VTPAVNDLFLKGQGDDKKVMDLVYVSSDQTEQQMKKYVPSPKWGVIPFANAEERAELKRHFGACGARETAELGMKAGDRKSGLPTLVVIDSETGNVLTRDGVDDIMGDDDSHDPKEALQKWVSQL
jgi:nucleoredoxin